MRRASGFTLIELLVVLALMALLIGVVPAALEGLRDNANYRGTLRSVMTEMRAARQQALELRQEARFVVNLRRRSYHREGAPALQVPAPLEMRVIVAGSESGGEQAAIRFFPEGGATGGSVEIIRPSGSGARLRVDWLSGRVSMEAVVP